MPDRVHLSLREEEALGYLAQGLTYSQIGRRMGITAHTVDTYLRRVRAKTGASSGAELIRLWLHAELRDLKGNSA